MATNKQQSIAAAKEAAKKEIENKILDLKNKGASDAEMGTYDPPSQEQGFSYDIMNYQAGWTSTGKSLPEGVEAVRNPNTLSFRSGCRDLEAILSSINNQEVKDDDIASDEARTAENKPAASLRGIVGGGLFSGRRNGVRDIIDGTFKPLIPSFNPNIGQTINTTEPVDPFEDAINALDSETQQPITPTVLQFEDSPFLGLGRRATIINRVDYAVPISNLSRDYGIEKSLVSDHVKNFNGSFYVLDANSDLKFYKNSLKIKKDYIRKNDNLSIFGDKATLNSASMESYFFKFGSDLRLTKGQEVSKFKRSFIMGDEFTGSINNQNKNNFNFEKLVDENVDLIDNTFSIQMPFENSELLNTLNLIGTSIIDVKQNYNFYIKEYEKISTNEYKNSQENVFPNLYVLNAILEENTEEKDFLTSLASLDGKSQSGKKFMLNKSEKIIFGIKDSIGEYFDSFGLNYPSLLSSNLSLHNSYKNKLNNIIFLSDSTDKLNEINKKKYMFPMSVEISVPTDKTTNLTKILIDSELMDNFIIKLYDLYINNQFVSKDSVITEQMYEQKIKPGDQEPEVLNKFSSKRKNINSINIYDLLEKIKQEPINLNKSNSTIIGDTRKYMRTDTNSMSFVNGLRNIIFNSKLNTFVRNNYRTYGDILDGKKSYNETVAYRISKYEINSSSPIQNYWIPNNPNLDVLNIIDTQVKYEKKYTYKIFAYQFVLGNKIKQKYNSERTPDNSFRIDIENLPEADLFEIQLLSTNQVVADTPPLSPEILFVPYFGVDNKIGLFLNGRIGQEKLEPINILSTDKDTTSLYSRDLKNNVLYKSDDIAKRFEVMKLDKKPSSYDDFSEGHIKSINTDVDTASIQSASSATFVDSIQPNKKYYYCFRTVDVHDKISNPTQIFEVEMVNEKGMIFPVIKNFEFEKPIYSNTKEIRRFIKIKPASQHAMLNKEISQIENDNTALESLRKIKLGASDVAVPWGKTFKMVVTSKQTGKKCEFKFKFKYKTE